MELLSPQNWKDYELIDSGNFEKLERFGQYITIRPEPQALWDKALSSKEWEKTGTRAFCAQIKLFGYMEQIKNHARPMENFLPS
ncbi:MAG: hypothetical protein KatS3mg035_1681 [Bacteroidia bacterium]|nr:MAG: hypothetical protein KatS3mg035_1681 [Bacteroidia bacterium]